MFVKCPTCGKKVRWEENPHRPFCSERCRLIDLGRWASGEYLIPGKEKVDVIGSSSESLDEKGNGEAEK